MAWSPHGRGGAELVPERVLLEDTAAGPIWFDPAVEDSELVPLDDADWEADLGAVAGGVRGQPCGGRGPGSWTTPGLTTGATVLAAMDSTTT